MNHEFWYVSRAAGFTAYLLLFASVALGIATSTRLGKRLISQNAIFDTHRFLSILALLFTVLHVYILLGDGYFNYSIIQLTLPFLSPYRFWPVAAGSFALYALVLVVLSFYMRKWLGYRTWRLLHFVTFALYAGATVHGITAGTDTSQAWARGLYLVTGAIVLALIGYRLQHRVPGAAFGRRMRLAAAGLTIVTGLVLVFGTGLLTKQPMTSVAGTPPSSPGALFVPVFAATVSGTYRQTVASTSSEIVMQGTADGDLRADFQIELSTQTTTPTPDAESPGEDAGEDETAENRPVQTVTRNIVQLSDPNSHTTLCDGTLASFQNGAARMRCDGEDALAGVQVAMQAQFQASNSGSFSGSMSGSMTRKS